jgi:rare lipoprotein A
MQSGFRIRPPSFTNSIIPSGADSVAMRGFLGKALAGLMLAVLAAGCGTTPVEQPQVSVPPNAGVYRVGQPYQVAGVWYYPREQPDYDETGIASWYGPGFYGNLTADGEMFTSKDLTAAHKTLPMPVNVRVTNLENGQSLVVRVNDRGPFATGRIIDLSERAAKLLGFFEKGTAKVRVQYVARADLPTGKPQPFGAGTPEEVQNAIPKVDTGTVETNALPDIPGTREATAKPLRDLPKPATSNTIGSADAGGLPSGQVTQVPVPAVTRLFIQMGAFGNYTNAARLAARLGPEVKISAIQRNGQTLYRVRSGPYQTTDDADAALTRYLGLGAADAHIIVDQ